MIGTTVLETVIFAMIAAFLGLRLYTVLGKKTGHEQTLVKPTESKVPTPIVSGKADDASEGSAPNSAPDAPYDDRAAAGIRAIMAADARFNPADFVEGAQSAYAMILEAFWKGDVAAFEDYVSADVASAFSDAVKTRKKAGETLDNRLIRIERATIAEASLSGKTARIMVRFDADIAAVTRNAEGKVIAGSLSDAVLTHDAWTFEKEIRSSDPNWVLVDTDEAA
jgi:predicted lipid-binding transport protein (Tim44 family)